VEKDSQRRRKKYVGHTFFILQRLLFHIEYRVVMHEDFLQPYNHSQEKSIYTLWEEGGFFAPDSDETKEPFCIIMPPPNANGSLHVGHAVGITIEDMMTRFARMRGKRALWLPAADHAGFETQVVFEKKLEKEGTSRFEVLKEEGGREKLYERIFAFTQENKKHMEGQVQELGASCDWSRSTFTLDPDVIEVVYRTFQKLYDDGLVYRDKRTVHWCSKHQTALSDLEVSWEEKDDELFYVTYRCEDGEGSLSVATTRPETIYGDVAVAVHPDDPRYSNWIGKKVLNPLSGESIPVVADEAVEQSFATGALKITPAHDALDFEIGKRHHLATIETIDFFGKMNSNAGELEGMNISDARKKAIEILEEKGLLEKRESYTHQVGVCYKCRRVIEPMILSQWFVDLTDKGKEKIVQPAIDAVTRGDITIIPDFQKKIFFHWLENIRDWNISRQIVWGIPIPVYYCESCEKEEVCIDGKAPSVCKKCSGTSFRKETDVFDTWFSSGQWPFATLQTTGEGDFDTFYPTSVMETAYDILFFWVARMVMLGIYTTGKIPFKTVYLHGLVRDKDKKKMSKSKGNVIDPLGIVDQYGADALRMALIVGNSPGQDVVISEEKIKGYRNFSNKLWNIARFIITHVEKGGALEESVVTDEDRVLYETCIKTKQRVAEQMDQYRFSQAAEDAYHYVWHVLADELIEAKKDILFKEDLSSEELLVQASARKVLFMLLLESLVMLHPFMPFVTEAIYQRLPDKKKSALIAEEWYV